MLKTTLDEIIAINGTPEELFLRDDVAAGGDPVQLGFAWYKPIYTRTITNCVYGDPIGCIDRVLLNRLEANTDFLERLLYEAHVARGNNAGTVTTAWDRIMYLYAADLTRIQSNIAALRASGYLFPDTPEPPLIPANTFPNYDQINEWEKCLHDIRVLFDGSQKNLIRRLGTFSLGTNYLLQLYRRR